MPGNTHILSLLVCNGTEGEVHTSELKLVGSNPTHNHPLLVRLDSVMIPHNILCQIILAP